MSYESFWLLLRKLSPRIAKAVDNSRHYKRKGGREDNYKLPPVRNGPITTCVWLVCALRYFAGAPPYDIMVPQPPLPPAFSVAVAATITTTTISACS